MESSYRNKSILDDQFALASVGKGGLLLDVASRTVLELNESARFVWERWLGGDSIESIAEALAARYSLPERGALDDVRTALAPQLNSEVSIPSEFRYERTSVGYSFFFRGDAVFELEPRGDRVKLVGRLDESRRMLPGLLRALAPKLLALRGEAVLHASAVEIAGGAVAFAGASGAGKTTTARTWAQAGAALVCEDQLLVRAQDSMVFVSRDAERAIATWVAAIARELEVSEEVGCGDLDAVSQGEFLPLREIGFLDVQRRIDDRYLFTELRLWETAGHAFRNAFYGSDETAHWRRKLDLAACIGRSVEGFDLILPNGLERLEEVTRRLVAAGTLRS